MAGHNESDEVACVLPRLELSLREPTFCVYLPPVLSVTWNSRGVRLALIRHSLGRGPSRGEWEWGMNVLPGAYSAAHSRWIPKGHVAKDALASTGYVLFTVTSHLRSAHSPPYQRLELPMGIAPVRFVISEV